MPPSEFKAKNVGESVFINTGKPKWNGALIRSTAARYRPRCARTWIKCGVPSETSTQSFQNGFGATLDGRVLAWKSGSKAIVPTEGSGNGPGQPAHLIASGASAIFFDTSTSHHEATPANRLTFSGLRALTVRDVL